MDVVRINGTSGQAFKIKPEKTDALLKYLYANAVHMPGSLTKKEAGEIKNHSLSLVKEAF